MASGASKGAKKIDAHNEGKLEGVNVALNAGPSTPIKYYEGMGYMPNLGAGRLNDKKIRIKKGGV